MNNIMAPTNVHNWVGKLKAHMRSKRDNPVQRVDPTTVNIQQELRREQGRKLRENGGILR